MRFTLIAAIIAGTWSLNAAASDRDNLPELVAAPVNKVFAPLGFDDNDNAELVLQGTFSNTCYKVGPATAVVDEATKTIVIDAKAYHYRGVGCAMVMVPFLQTVPLGLLAEGEYKVSVIARPDAETWPLTVAKAQTRNPDDFLYAPVERVKVETDASGSHTLAVEGSYPFMLIGCMKIVEVRAMVTPGRVIVVLPITEIFEDDADCKDQATSKKFRVEKRIADATEQAEYLMHVRALAGQSLNLLADFGG